MNGKYLSVVAWNNVKPTMNLVYKTDLGRYSWSNSEFIDDVTQCADMKYAQHLVAYM